jgi:hypothetical protein
MLLSNNAYYHSVKYLQLRICCCPIDITSAVMLNQQYQNATALSVFIPFGGGLAGLLSTDKPTAVAACTAMLSGAVRLLLLPGHPAPETGGEFSLSAPLCNALPAAPWRARSSFLPGFFLLASARTPLLLPHSFLLLSPARLFALTL